ncbi:U-box domain-containing protein 62 [Zea mays]|uniref:U-box domain-containing protein 62 n=1 Tax=Zea mays TaxID=4577 RepID=A0A1D6L987_MAIZE|nr:U-box domain-containing protein 62 [Zea mays]
MASPAGANSGASSSRGTPLPLPFPFPAAAHFPSRGAGPFLSQHYHPPSTSDGDDEVEEDEGSMDDGSAEEDDAELSDGGALGSPRRRAFSAPGEPRVCAEAFRGVLMDDALILSCGHSYGSSGMQHVYRMKACGKCGMPITEAAIRPNLALRLAVQAFKREEDSAKSLKRRRERLELGNKRTPERFVGRQAVVTAQCLNGWYVVKTSDNAESVKLQYRSLAKVADGNGPSGLVPSNVQSTSWL